MDSLDIAQTPARRAPAANGAQATAAAGNAPTTDGDAFLALIEGFMAAGTFPGGPAPAGPGEAGGEAAWAEGIGAEATAGEGAETADGLLGLIAPSLLLAGMAPAATEEAAPGLPGAGIASAAAAGAAGAAVPGAETGEAAAGALGAAEGEEAALSSTLSSALAPALSPAGEKAAAEAARLAVAAEGGTAGAGTAGDAKAAGTAPPGLAPEGAAEAAGAAQGEARPAGVTNDAPPAAQERHAAREREGGWGGERHGAGDGQRQPQGQSAGQPGQAGATEEGAAPRAAEAAAAAPGRAEAAAQPQPGFADTIAALSGRHEDEARPALSVVQGGAQAAAQDGPDLPGAAHQPRAQQPHPASEMVAVQIARLAKGKGEQMTIQLRPVELGSVEIRLEFGQEGRVKAIVRAERPETLELLQRDARGLEKALQDAGLQTDAGGLEFGLRDGGGRQQAERGFAELHKAFSRLRGERAAEDGEALRNLTIAVGAGHPAANDRVDIRI